MLVLPESRKQSLVFMTEPDPSAVEKAKNLCVWLFSILLYKDLKELTSGLQTVLRTSNRLVQQTTSETLSEL